MENLDEEIEESKKTYKEKEIKKWSEQDVLDWIVDLEKEKGIKNNEWKTKLEKEKPDGKCLILYEEKHLKDMGFVSGEYVKIFKALEELKKKGKSFLIISKVNKLV